jgi:hypothetical protein
VKDHLLLMVWHAFLVSVFFSFLWRHEARERRRLFIKAFGIMVLGGFLLSWLMYPFP